MQKLNCILLVDDDLATNFYNKEIIRQLNCAEKVVVKTSVKEALDYLSSPFTKENPRPDLVLHDLNMPGVDGWDFIEAFNEMPYETQHKSMLVMLSNAINPTSDHREDLASSTAFIQKPLSEDRLAEIVECASIRRLAFA